MPGEQRIGFRKTGNFKDLYAEKGEYSMCGYAPRFHLPYSYEAAVVETIENLLRTHAVMPAQARRGG